MAGQYLLKLSDTKFDENLSTGAQIFYEVRDRKREREYY
jgi:hypothetical protein